MKKIGVIFILIILMTTLIACGNQSKTKGFFVDLEALTKSVSFMVEIEDPEKEITGNVVVEIMDKETGLLVDSRALTMTNLDQLITFTNLTSAKEYQIVIKATIGRQAVAIASHVVKLKSLEEVTITTVDQFMAMKDNPEGNYALGSNIDFTGIDFVSPFNSASKAFSGSFDGKNHELKNISFNNISQNMGVFGYISTGSVKNLDLNYVSIGTEHRRLETATSAKIGILAGYVSHPNAKIEHINIRNSSIYVSSNSSYQFYVGGVIGDLRSVITDIQTNNLVVDVLMTSFAKVNVGGFAGFVGESAAIRKVKTNATIKFELKGKYTDTQLKNWNISVGGIAGDYNSRISRGLENIIHTGNIDVILDYGTVEGQLGTYDAFVGGISGKAFGHISHVLYEGSINVDHIENVNEKHIVKSFYIGGITGYFQGTLAIHKAAYNSQDQHISSELSSDAKVFQSYTVGSNASSLTHNAVYTGNGVLHHQGLSYTEKIISTHINSLEGYFDLDWIKSN